MRHIPHGLPEDVQSLGIQQRAAVRQDGGRNTNEPLLLPEPWRGILTDGAGDRCLQAPFEPSKPALLVAGGIQSAMQPLVNEPPGILQGFCVHID